MKIRHKSTELTRSNITEEVTVDPKEGNPATAADDEDCENEGDPTTVVEKTILEKANPTSIYGCGASRVLTIEECRVEPESDT